MSDRDTWIVRLGELYLGGLGKSFSNPACAGWVMTKIREHAEHFTSLETARSAAQAIGGTVVRVAPAIKVGPPAATGTAPGTKQP